MQIEVRKIADLLPYARNSRTHSKAHIGQIVASIREFGWTNPVLVDEGSCIIAGHGRVLAASALNLNEVPTITLSGLSDLQKRAYVIADNKLALNAGWDEAMLAGEMNALLEGEFNIDVLGFSNLELDELLGPEEAGLTDPDEVPEVPKEPVSQLGDVWVLGDHRVACGSSTDKATVKALLNGEKPHLLISDPPYGVAYDANWRNEATRADGTPYGAKSIGKVLNDDMADWSDAWALFPGHVAYIWHGGLHTAEVVKSLEKCRFQIRAQIVWVKQRMAISRGHYHWQHEPAVYAVKQNKGDHWRFIEDHEIAAYAVKEGGTGHWSGGRKQTTVWNIEVVKNDTGHSTQKPVECMKRPMENNSELGDAVYDPFLGSSTSIIAAQISGRRCFGCELNPPYVDVGVKRWEAFTGLQATLASTGKTFAEVTIERQG